MEDRKNKNVIGLNIRSYRGMKRWTQGELADALHCSRHSVSDWENGKSAPSGYVLALIAMKLGVTVDDLLKEEYK